MSNKFIPVVFITDEGYIVPTIVAMQSIIDNKNADTAYRFYILADELSEKSKAMIESLNSDMIETKIILSSIEKYNNIHQGVENSYCQATETALLKFDIPDLINEDRIIYLDGDLICLKDLTELYNTDLEGNWLAAVTDSGKAYTGRDFVKECPTYFNSGVMIMDLENMRKNQVGRELYDIKKNMTDSKLMDQDVFNTFFMNRVKLLPIRYNFLYINLLRAQENGNLEINKLNDLFSTNYPNLSSIYEDAAIIHFASKNKPWKDVNVTLHDVWMHYYENSPAGNESEYLYTQQIKWLTKECEQLSLENSRKNRKIKELRRSYQLWKGKCTSYERSVSFRVGRKLTAPLRFVRDKLKEMRKANLKKNKYNSLVPIPTDGLNKEPRDKKLILSMTSYGPRLKTVHITVGTLLRQTVKPDKIVVCISEADYKNITPQMKKLEKMGMIEIMQTEDLRSPHMKYFFTMQKYPDDIIITVDDDVIYRADLVEKLYEAYKQFPECVCACRVHRMRLDEEGGLRPYREWKMRSSEYILMPRNDYFATGVGGVLYPPHIMHEDLFRLDIIKETCLKADDVWLKFMELLNGVKVVLADRNQALEYIDDTQQAGLFNNNVGENQNDIQIDNVLDHYGREKLIEMIHTNY
ncbi:MAG: glycosyltransferase family 8 protein [Huintestinicola sp.]